jgi:transcriptional regulator with GAF, ATPase, and Fis domain
MDQDCDKGMGIPTPWFAVAPLPDYPSRAMRGVMDQIRVVARSASHVLLLGESGSGKDFAAMLIHKLSGKAEELFITVNCPGMDKHVIQSELFGHEKGAFTGAESLKRGLVELADGGTLFLNEIGELALDLQSKLLTFLDGQRFNRLGGLRQVQVKARVIAATNRAIEEEVARGRFRSDLYYRLSVVSVILPPLRERIEDIPILVGELLADLSQKMGLAEFPVVDQRDMKKLADHDWPGNVRELRNVLEKGIMFGHGKHVNLGWFDAIRKKLQAQRTQSQEKDELSPASNVWSWCTDFPERDLSGAMKRLKKAVIEEALRKTGGNKRAAARLLGIDRHTLERISERA